MPAVAKAMAGYPPPTLNMIKNYSRYLFLGRQSAVALAKVDGGADGTRTRDL